MMMNIVFWRKLLKSVCYMCIYLCERHAESLKAGHKENENNHLNDRRFIMVIINGVCKTFVTTTLVERWIVTRESSAFARFLIILNIYRALFDFLTSSSLYSPQSVSCTLCSKCSIFSTRYFCFNFFLVLYDYNLLSVLALCQWTKEVHGRNEWY